MALTNEELKAIISIQCPLATFDETGEWMQVHVPVETWKALAVALNTHQQLGFDYLFCLTNIDWKTHFTMVYHLESTKFRHIVVIKVKLERDSATVDTVSDIWPTAEFHEREVFDLFGVQFINHPDLRRLLLTDDWKGYPLRKDYEDPINMIKL